MNKSELHPTVADFKEFLNQHPDLVVAIRKKGDPFQSYYEKWIILGEEDLFWNQYKKNEPEIKEDDKVTTHTEMVGQLLKMVEKVDFNNIEKRVEQFSNTLNIIQSLIGEFVTTKEDKPKDNHEPRRFNLFRD